MTYNIYERTSNGTKRLVGSVSSDHPKQAFFMALGFVKKKYQEAGIEQPMFDADPRFFAEAVG